MKRKQSSRKIALSRQLIKSKKQLPRIRGDGDQTKRLNEILVDLSKKTEIELKYWKIFQSFLVDEREQRKERIHDALRSSTISGYENDQLVRIVDTRYQTRPLSSYGSIVVPPGGRFNVGEISPHYQRFQALYLASDFNTAAAERFLRDQPVLNEVEQESLNFRLDPHASFSFYRVGVSNLSVIDIRDDKNLEAFTNVIAEIEAPPWIHVVAKAFKQNIPRTLKTIEELKMLLFDKNFTQWGSLLDQPAASQWFGYYVREAGIHGIIYPSVRSGTGHNLAIFPDTFEDGPATVQLLDEAGGVKQEDRSLTGSNALFQMQISTQMKSEITH